MQSRYDNWSAHRTVDCPARAARRSGRFSPPLSSRASREPLTRPHGATVIVSSNFTNWPHSSSRGLLNGRGGQPAAACRSGPRSGNSGSGGSRSATFLTTSGWCEWRPQLAQARWQLCAVSFPAWHQQNRRRLLPLRLPQRPLLPPRRWPPLQLQRVCQRSRPLRKPRPARPSRLRCPRPWPPEWRPCAMPRQRRRQSQAPSLLHSHRRRRQLLRPCNPREKIRSPLEKIRSPVRQVRSPPQPFRSRQPPWRDPRRRQLRADLSPQPPRRQRRRPRRPRRPAVTIPGRFSMR